MSVELPESDVEILDLLKEPKMSIDRMTLLLYTPGLSLYEADYNVTDFEGQRVREAINSFIDFIEKLLPKDDSGKVQHSLQTKLYAYHYRVAGIDIQFCTKLPRTSVMRDGDFIEVFGDDEEKARGYMYEYYNNDYNIRLEYNPNKVNISDISEILNCVRKVFYKDHRLPKFFKVSRLDLAFDYPASVNPCLINFLRSRKYDVHGGSEGVETVYFGARKSRYNLVVYDKKKEYQQIQNVVYPGAHLWRIELRVHESFYLQYYPELSSSVLPRIEIFHSGQKTGDWAMDLMLRDAMHWGMRNTLNTLPRETKKRYLKMYRELCLSPLLHPQELYLMNIRSVWETERLNILNAFGFESDLFGDNKVADWKL